MNPLFILSLLLCYCGFTMGQSVNNLPKKPPIDTSILGKWPTVDIPKVSTNGIFVLYQVNNKPFGRRSLILKSILGKVKMEWTGVESNAHFTNDSKKVIFSNSNGDLCIFTVQDSTIEYIPNVFSFKLFSTGDTEWLIYQQLNPPSTNLILRDLLSGKERSFSNVKGFWINPNGSSLVYKTEVANENGIMQSLHIFNLFNDKIKSIWQGVSTGSLIFGNHKLQLAFLGIGRTNQKEKSIWYYKEGMNDATLLSNGQLTEDSSFELNGLSRFSNDGDIIFIQLKKNNKSLQNSSGSIPKVHIWSHKDPKLQSQQLYELENSQSKSFEAVINIVDHRIIQLEREDERIISRDKLDNYVLIQKMGKGDIFNEWYWNSTALSTILLVSIRNGAKDQIFDHNHSLCILSPNGKYVVYFGVKERNYFSLEINSGKIRNITSDIKTTWTTYNRNDEPVARYNVVGTAGFLDDNTGVLIYDQNDIWQVDISEGKNPINLTNGYGRKHNAVLYIINDQLGMPVKIDGDLVVGLFNRNNKNNGFCKITIGKSKSPEIFSIGPYLYVKPPGSEANYFGEIIKIRNSNSYIIGRMSASESLNFFLTDNFRTFIPLTDVYPEKSFNWIKTELITWDTSHGIYSQGIMYKPDDFNPRKKYPVIFHYYERKSDLLNEFLLPTTMDAELNIPFFVSNGYLVFTPDIRYTIGKPGESACNTIVSAAKYLSKMQWVDSKKLGLQGHSFGGSETNFIITKTSMFAAAASGAGISNYISSYNAIMDPGNGSSRQYFYEYGQSRIGFNLWQRPDLYIKNSPIFEANKVTTPLLLLHNKEDIRVPFAQGMEFFIALRYLKKKVWLLQYDDEGHVIDKKENQLDFTLRMKQFFDHYLKEVPAPKWMTKGIRAAMRGNETGYELDSLGSCGNNCKICEKINIRSYKSQSEKQGIGLSVQEFNY